jgi:ubiquinone/menaquinone biosynthesis C-methylase UbiE
VALPRGGRPGDDEAEKGGTRMTGVERKSGAIPDAEMVELREIVDESLSPRGPEILFDLFARFDIPPGALVLDLSGQDASDAIQLALRFDCRVLLIDTLGRGMDLVSEQIREQNLRDRITTDLGQVEALPVLDGDIDFIWCRDLLNRVDLPRALGECFRGLRPGGGMLVYQSFATELLEQSEARRMFDALGLIGEYSNAGSFERVVRQTGFTIEHMDVIDSEWRELWLESGDRGMIDDLLHIARMRRTQDQLISRYGKGRYETMYAEALWGIYQLIGKFKPSAYLLHRPFV